MNVYKVVFADGKVKADICDVPICKELQNKIVPNPVNRGQFMFYTEAVNEEAAKNYFKFAFMIFLRERGLVI